MAKTTKGLTVALALAASSLAFAQQHAPQQQTGAQTPAPIAGAPYGVPGYYAARWPRSKAHTPRARTTARVTGAVPESGAGSGRMRVNFDFDGFANGWMPWNWW